MKKQGGDNNDNNEKRLQKRSSRLQKKPHRAPLTSVKEKPLFFKAFSNFPRIGKSEIKEIIHLVFSSEWPYLSHCFPTHLF